MVRGDEMAEFDLAIHIQRSRTGPCFVCAYSGGHPDYEHESLYADNHVVAFLSQYPTLLGYAIVAPRAHVVDVTGDRRLFRQLTEVVQDGAEELKSTVPTERGYLMSLGSHQGNPMYTGMSHRCRPTSLMSGNSSML
jgi:diadenosine tetraphosphate (Ap4A) HIT family hydrolase